MLLDLSEKTKGVAPGFLLLPARNYEWEVGRKVSITVPLKGSMQELLESAGADAKTTVLGGEDAFSIFEDGLLQLWTIVGVLFAGVQYPDLEENEALNVVALEFKTDTVVLHAVVIRSV